MGQKRQYFVCKCGAWTWASKVQQGQTHCQQCGKKWPAPAPAKQQPRNPQKPPKAPSPAPQRNTKQRDKREEERRLKRAVTTIWDQIPEEARSHLTQAGWRGPPRAKEANDQATDPLLSLLAQRKDELPEDVRAAVVEATSTPEPTAGEKALQSNKDLSKASSRLRVLVNKKIKLLESIEEAKESLCLQLQELQETTEKIHDAETAVEKAKLELTKAVEPPPGVKDVPDTPEPMDVEELVTALGLTLSDEQQERLAEYRAKGKEAAEATRGRDTAGTAVVSTRLGRGTANSSPRSQPPEYRADRQRRKPKEPRGWWPTPQPHSPKEWRWPSQ